jgi:hypothetical protein
VVRCSLAAVFTGGSGRGVSIGRLHGHGRRWHCAGMRATMEQRRRAGGGGRGTSEGQCFVSVPSEGQWYGVSLGIYNF